MALCSATKADGRPCRAQALVGGTLCMFHDPERAAEVAAIRRAGGYHRRTKRGSAVYPVTLRSVQDVQELIEAALADTVQQENSATRTRALVGLAGTALRTLEVGELETRLAALETRLGLRETQTEEAETDAQSNVGAA